jgi:hypothetical protein
MRHEKALLIQSVMSYSAISCFKGDAPFGSLDGFFERDKIKESEQVIP